MMISAVRKNSHHYFSQSASPGEFIKNLHQSCSRLAACPEEFGLAHPHSCVLNTSLTGVKRFRTSQDTHRAARPSLVMELCLDPQGLAPGGGWRRVTVVRSPCKGFLDDKAPSCSPNNARLPELG
ncbi:uncharacterized protein LOC143665379 [Tamandua tetradactyla]|uniref:uncharacterized protein LOC143665379 n=1 Tax=Tamandua tetradactyla TaxID=48850 RepID=UPI004053E3F9